MERNAFTQLAQQYSQGILLANLQAIHRPDFIVGRKGKIRACCIFPGGRRPFVVKPPAPLRMNILLLMADEFRRDAAGFSGNVAARTPALDRLAESGRVFTNACTPSPVCVPARQCLATGRYAFRDGCEDFHDDLAPGAPTFARWFADHGYYTVACGKLHHRGPDQMQGWLHRIGSESAVRWPEAFAGRPQIGRRKWRGAPDVLEAGPGLSPLALHDELTIQGTCDFLRMHFGGMYDLPAATPLLLLVSLQQPHFPLLCDPTLFDKHWNSARLPEIPDHPAHPILARSALELPEHAVLRARAAYAAMVEATDRRFQRVLETLAACGQCLDDWLVIFTSDHGDMLGDHGCWEKRSFYEQSVGVPLVVRGPGFSPGRDPRISNLVDLFPTLCTAAGPPVPGGLDGRDLRLPNTRTISQLGRSHFLLRKDRWKFLTFGGEAPDVLFDLEDDPHETRNLADSDPASASCLRRELAEITDGRSGMC